MFKWLRTYNFRMNVQAEIKAQTGDQDLVFRLCNSTEAIDVIKNLHTFLITQYGYTSGVGSFMTAFPVYALALKRQDFSLSEKMRIATWINDADAKARKNFKFYTTYAQLFMSAQSAMHEFCLEHELDPYEQITKE